MTANMSAMHSLLSSPAGSVHWDIKPSIMETCAVSKPSSLAHTLKMLSTTLWHSAAQGAELLSPASRLAIDDAHAPVFTPSG